MRNRHLRPLPTLPSAKSPYRQRSPKEKMHGRGLPVAGGRQAPHSTEYPSKKMAVIISDLRYSLLPEHQMALITSGFSLAAGLFALFRGLEVRLVQNVNFGTPACRRCHPLNAVPYVCAPEHALRGPCPPELVSVASAWVYRVSRCNLTLRFGPSQGDEATLAATTQLGGVRARRPPNQPRGPHTPAGKCTDRTCLTRQGGPPAAQELQRAAAAAEGEPRLTAAIHMDIPCCSCELTLRPLKNDAYRSDHLEFVPLANISQVTAYSCSRHGESPLQL